MKIKDIREFRTFYKEKIRQTQDTNRDEHFIGAEVQREGKSVFGFFDLYHGDKIKEVVGGIGGFLEGFLEMAQDTQAVYEFMQNAVDAESSHFSMIWGRDKDDDENDYLLVLNNGKVFDFASIRSILNVGVSTKNSQDDTIGKFGIGFKLAHRLVGKDNGIDELLQKNYGPILFSWQNSEIQALLSGEVGEILPIKQNYTKTAHNSSEVLIEGQEPWLFKILITNFPTQPEEPIKDAYYNEINDALTKEDIYKLSRWIAKHKAAIPIEEYQTGSLFFLKLGENKSQKLADIHLKEGIKFSLSILNKVANSSKKELNKVHLNGEDIESARLIFEDFSVKQGEKDYNKIKFGKETVIEAESKNTPKEANIQLLFGYTDYKEAVKLINNVPNFYLFFPLSEEKHRFHFILHSNAFYKKSARTSLHTDAINQRLLEVFVTLLIEKMQTYAVSPLQAEKEKFLRIYPNLLLSKESEDSDKEWVNKSLIRGIHQYLKMNIPVIVGETFNIVNETDKIRIKETELDLSNEDWGINKKWFYWGNEPILKEAALNILGIKVYTIRDLLQEKEISLKINAYLEKEPEIRATLLAEINEHISEVVGTGPDTEIFKENFHALKLFAFDNETYLSINELKDRQADDTKYLLLFEEIEKIKHLLQKAGFICTQKGLSEYKQIQDFIRKRQSISYYDYKVLNEYLSQGFEQTSFSIEEKHTIFKVLEDAKSKELELERNQRMQALKLFSNEQGDVLGLGALLKNATKAWLNPFVINEKERQDYLNRYLISDEMEVFSQVVIPFWDKVIADKQGFIKNDINAFYADIIAFQKESKETRTLETRTFVPLIDKFSAPNKDIFYQSEWTQLSDSDYKSLTFLYKTLFGKDLPLKTALPYLKQPPFNLSLSDYDSLELLKVSFSITEVEANLLAKSASVVNMPLFYHFVIESAENEYIIRNKKANEAVVWCEENNLRTYIATYHKDLFICPNLVSCKDLISLKEKKLIESLIKCWESKDDHRDRQLAAVIILQEESVKHLFLKKIGKIDLYLTDFQGYEKLQNVVKIAISCTNYEEVYPLFKQNLTIHIDAAKSFSLHNISHTSSDSVYFGDTNEYLLKLSQIFPDQDTDCAKYIESVIEKLHQDCQYEKTRLNALFNIHTDQAKKEILSHIDATIKQEGYLQNGSQLAYILLYKKYEDSGLDLDEYKLKNRGLVPLDGTFAISHEYFALFQTDTYLALMYENVADILKLSPTSPSFKIENVGLYLQPVIDNNTILGPRLKQNLSANEQIELLNFLLGYFQMASYLNNTLSSWGRIFGFNLQLFVVSAYTLTEKETLPKHILEWLEDGINQREQKESLLASLGVNMKQARINTLRKNLLAEAHFDIEEPNPIPIGLLANTLTFLWKHNSNFTFSENHQSFKVLQSIVNKCFESNIFDIPLPVLTSEVGKYRLSKEIENIYYFDIFKKTELDSSEIYLSDILSKTNLLIYNACTWKDSPTLKSQLKEIQVLEKVNKEILEEESYSNEWNDSFYEKWKITYNQYHLYFYKQCPLNTSIGNEFIKTIYLDRFCIFNGQIYCPNKYSFNEIVKTLKTTDWLSEEAILHLEELYSKHKDQISELLNNPISDEEIRKLVDDKKRELQEIADRRELKESLLEKEYSYKWFLDFVKVQTLQTNEDKSTAEQQISFMGVEYELNSDKLLQLKDPNRTVTPTIEYCTGFYAIFHFKNGRQINVNIRDVSKKGQQVLAMLEKPEQLKGENFKEIKHIDLYFSKTMNLLDKLLKAFRDLGKEKAWEDDFDLKANLSTNINFIYGPPGTGKTTKIAERLITLMDKEPEAKILVLTPTNMAADVLTEKIISTVGSAPNWLVRYGTTFSDTVEGYEVVKDGNSFNYQFYSQCVFISTIHRLPYEEFILRMENKEAIKEHIANVDWDYVIFDEASMIPLAYIMYALHKCKNGAEKKTTQYWVAGDPCQIPPIVNIVNEDLPTEFNKDKNIYSLIGLSSFDEIEQKKIPIYGDKIENLNIQYRSVEMIGALFSKFTYLGKLSHGRIMNGTNHSKELPSKVQQLNLQPITLLKYPVNSKHIVYHPMSLQKSHYQLYSAILIFEFIKDFEKQISAEEKWTIGIVCPYKAQATLVNQMVESLKLPHNLDIIIDTVHAFQGSECDIVFFILNPPSDIIKNASYGAFIHKHFLINVAISRAKDYLIIVYPDDGTAGIENLVKVNIKNSQSIEDILQNQMGITLEDITIEAKVIEKYLFNEEEFIKKNIETSKHQMINVYNVTKTRYLIKESPSAIDIQFKSS